MIIKYSKSSLKFLAKLEKKSIKRIVDGIEKLTLTPPEGDIKPLQGDPENRMRLRIGTWRIIYKYDTDNIPIVLQIIDIGNRGDIYK